MSRKPILRARLAWVEPRMVITDRPVRPTLPEFVLARCAEREQWALSWCSRPSRHLRDKSKPCSDPARVLSWCETVLLIVGWHSYDWNPRGLCMACDVEGPCPTLLALALPDATHPDYDPAWAI